MNVILAIPLPIRIAAIFVVGSAVGALVNIAVLRLRFEPRTYSPWNAAWDRCAAWWLRWFGDPAERQAVAAPAPTSRAEQPQEKRKKKGKRKKSKRDRAFDPGPRRWSDKLPVLGWWYLRRESPLHGRFFWLRPLVVELALGLVFASLYWAVTVQGRPLPPGAVATAGVLHLVFVSQVLLISLMLTASLIDLDEFIIPDAVTVTGTLLGLLLAALLPDSLLPVHSRGSAVEFLHVASPQPFPEALAAGRAGSLGLALGCVWLWCFALLPRQWYGRRGWWFALGLIVTRIRRKRWSLHVLVIGLLVSALVVPLWLVGGPCWRGLLSALVGMMAGGGIIWVVRLIGALMMRREAMGFGDVTLMCMIGTFLGWQSCLMVFFIGPFFGLVPGLAEWALRRQTHIPIPYGPFLCLGAATVIVFWASLWEKVSPVFTNASLVLFGLGVCAVLLMVLLGIIQVIKALLGAR